MATAARRRPLVLERNFTPAAAEKEVLPWHPLPGLAKSAAIPPSHENVATFPRYYCRVKSLAGIVRTAPIPAFNPLEGKEGALLFFAWKLFRGPQTLAEVIALHLAEAGVSLETALGPDFVPMHRLAVCGHPMPSTFEDVEIRLRSVEPVPSHFSHFIQSARPSGYLHFLGPPTFPLCWEFRTEEEEAPISFLCCITAAVHLQETMEGHPAFFEK